MNKIISLLLIFALYMPTVQAERVQIIKVSGNVGKCTKHLLKFNSTLAYADAIFAGAKELISSGIKNVAVLSAKSIIAAPLTAMKPWLAKVTLTELGAQGVDTVLGTPWEALIRILEVLENYYKTYSFYRYEKDGKIIDFVFKENPNTRTSENTQWKFWKMKRFAKKEKFKLDSEKKQSTPKSALMKKFGKYGLITASAVLVHEFEAHWLLDNYLTGAITGYAMYLGSIKNFVERVYQPKETFRFARELVESAINSDEKGHYMITILAEENSDVYSRVLSDPGYELRKLEVEEYIHYSMLDEFEQNDETGKQFETYRVIMEKIRNYRKGNVDSILEATEDVSKVIKEASELVDDDVKDIIKNKGEVSEEVKKELKEDLKEAKKEVKENIKQATEEVKEKIEEIKEDVKETVEEIKEEVKESVEDIKNDLSDK